MSIARKGLLLVAIPLVAQIVFLVTLMTMRREENRHAASVVESNELIARISSLEASLAGAAAGTRGYVASGGAPLLGLEFEKAAAQARLHSYALITLAASDRESHSMASTIDRESRRLLDDYARITSLQDSKKAEEAAALLLQLVQGERLVQVHKLITELKARENVLVRERSRAVSQARGRSEKLVFVGFVISAVVAIGLGAFFYRHISQRLRQLANNARAIESGAVPTPIGGDDELSEVDGAVRDARETVIRTTSRLRANAARLSRLNEVQSDLMGTSLDLARLLDLMSESARELTGAEGAAVEVAESHEMACRAASGSAAASVNQKVPRDGSLAGASLASGTTLIFDDTEVDARVQGEARRGVDARSMVVVPLYQRSRPWGVLKIISSQVNAFPPSAINTVELLARSFSGGISNASLYETRSMEAEERSVELASLRNRFEAFMDNMPVLAYLKDGKGRYIYANRAMSEEVARRGLDDPLGMTAKDWMPPHTAKEVEEQDLEILASNRPVKSTETLHLALGSSHFLLLRFPIIEPDGRRFLGGVSIDVTERIDAEAEVRRLNEELEERVRSRTQELEAANGELEAFTYSVSHDLRAPLRAVSGYVRMFEEDFGSTLTDEGARLLGVIRQSASTMGQLIDELLRFSRLSRQPLNVALVDTAALVREVTETLARENGGAQPEVLIGSLPHVQADVTLLRQVFVNLISNAIKFSSRKEKSRIEIGSGMVEDNVVFHVRDNGSGFDMQYVDKLFGVFQRLHRPDEFEGTGVGLAIVQRIVARHGGRVWAEGQPGQGATFYFSLPVETT